jgi:hypothetical protein
MDTSRTLLRKPLTADRDGPAAGASSVEAAWLVLEAANDLRDDAAVAACRRVIDARLNGTPAARSDLNLVQHYFS